MERVAYICAPLGVIGLKNPDFPASSVKLPMRKEVFAMKTWLSATLASAVLLCAWAASVTWAQTEVTEDGVISGTMTIDFKTRTQLDTSGDLKEGSAALGVQDLYKFALNVAKTTEFAGEIKRQPTLYSSILQRHKQAGQLVFDLKLSVLNPRDLTQKKQVGSWVGTLPHDPATGTYDLAGGAAVQSPLRIAVDAVGTAKSFSDNFSGKLVGKAEKKEGLAAYTYKRVVGNKSVEFKVNKSDPMKFENVVLAKGPAESYPRTTLNGRLDYDYETGNWLTDGLRFRYSLDGTDHEDIVTGTIKWVEEGDYTQTGKGYYEFNLRFNEEKHKPASTEESAFGEMSEEDAFFAVDNSLPSLTGRVSYVDTMMPGKDAPSQSQVTYALNANKLTKQQIMNFFKMWMVAVGPTNDE
jgi:hypothetical protein